MSSSSHNATHSHALTDWWTDWLPSSSLLPQHMYMWVLYMLLHNPSNHIRSVRWWIDNNFDLATYCYWHVKSSFEYLWADADGERWMEAEDVELDGVGLSNAWRDEAEWGVLPNHLHLLTNILQLTFGNKHNSISTLQCQRWIEGGLGSWSWWVRWGVHQYRKALAKHLITFTAPTLRQSVSHLWNCHSCTAGCHWRSGTL